MIFSYKPSRRQNFRCGKYATAQGVKGASQPVSRVLSRTVIHLGRRSLASSSNLPEPRAGHAIGFLFGLAPGGVFPATPCYHVCGALLPHLFTLTGHRSGLGGIFSVALSVGLRRPGVTWHLALWSPDFPPPSLAATVRPTRRGRLRSSRGQGKLHRAPSNCCSYDDSV